MAAITQPTGFGLSQRLYGSFAGKALNIVIRGIGTGFIVFRRRRGK